MSNIQAESVFTHATHGLWIFKKQDYRGHIRVKWCHAGASPVALWLSLVCSASMAQVLRFRSCVWTYTTCQPCCGGDPHIKRRKIGTDVSSGRIFISKKERKKEKDACQLPSNYLWKKIHFCFIWIDMIPLLYRSSSTYNGLCPNKPIVSWKCIYYTQPTK